MAKHKKRNFVIILILLLILIGVFSYYFFLQETSFITSQPTEQIYEDCVYSNYRNEKVAKLCYDFSFEEPDYTDGDTIKIWCEVGHLWEAGGSTCDEDGCSGIEIDSPYTLYLDSNSENEDYAFTCLSRYKVDGVYEEYAYAGLYIDSLVYNEPPPECEVGDKKCDGNYLKECLNNSYNEGILCEFGCDSINLICKENPSTCGNNICDNGETYITCPEDCEPPQQEPKNYIGWIILIIGIILISLIVWGLRRRK